MRWKGMNDPKKEAWRLFKCILCMYEAERRKLKQE